MKAAFLRTETIKGIIMTMAYNVDTHKCEQIKDEWVFGGTHILIGSQDSVLEYCAELRKMMLELHYPSDAAKVQSICWLKDGRMVVGFGTM